MSRSPRQAVALTSTVVLLLALVGFLVGLHLAAPSTTSTQELQRTSRVPGKILRAPPVLSAAARTVELSNSGCGDPVIGTAFAVAHGYLVTNAHVVAGTREHLVMTAKGQTIRATVVLFDPNLDVAILHAPGSQPGGIIPDTADTGTSVAFAGFASGRRHVSGAEVRSLMDVTKRDIYDRHDVHRRVIEIAASVHGGDSGAPLLNPLGRYVGMVYGYSISDPHVAYALPADAMQRDIQRGAGRTRAVRTGHCLG